MPRKYTPKVPSICEHCGKTRWYRPCEVQKYCCRGCYVKASSAKIAAAHVSKPCEHCGQPITGPVWKVEKARYCSVACTNKAKVQDVGKRFWSKVDECGPDECWEFAAVGTDGYGKFWYRGRSVHASRMSYELTHEPVPDDMCVCHKCDNPRCVNPSHLFLGSNRDNSQDMLSKNRAAIGNEHWTRKRPEKVRRGDQHVSRTNPECLRRGSRHPNSKLNEDAVKAIRQRAESGETLTSLAREFGVTPTTTCSIVKRKTWTHV